MRFLKVKCGRKTIIEPLEKIGLFKHCTGGFISINIEEFKKETIPILQAHGIQMITYEERSDANK